MSRRMNSFLLIVLAAIATSSHLAAASIQDVLQTPVWYLQYDVAFTVNASGTTKHDQTTNHHLIKLERKLSANTVLDMRMDGPSPTLGASFLTGSGSSEKPSNADQMKFAQDMMARMTSAANWMPGGYAGSTDEEMTTEQYNAAAADMMSSQMGPGSMNYLRIDTTFGLVNELGQPFTRVVHATRIGSGSVMPAATTITLEVDAPTASYQIILPYAFMGMNAKMKTESRTTDIFKSGETVNEDPRINEVGLDLEAGKISFDDPKSLQAAMLLVKGTVDPSSGQIRGEKSFPVHYSENEVSLPGTVKVRFTLTTTPPAKGK